MITGIVVALPEELRTLTTQKIAKGSSAFIRNDIAVAYAGAGAENAGRAAQMLVGQGATRLLSWGCAAALSAQLKPGDLVLAGNLLTVENTGLLIDPVWHKASLALLAEDLKVSTGSLLESRHLVSSSQEKQQLYAQTSALALDMESAAVARIAMQHGFPMLVVRAIADPVVMDLPQAVAYALTADGDVSLTKLLFFLIKHPSELPGLIKLGLHFNAATKTLVKVAKLLEFVTNFKHTHNNK